MAPRKKKLSAEPECITCGEEDFTCSCCEEDSAPKKKKKNNATKKVISGSDTKEASVAVIPVTISDPVPFEKMSFSFGPKAVRLGLCCINNTLKELKPPIFCSRGMTLATVEKKGLDALKELCLNNVRDLIPLLEWNEAHGIKCLRISSDMFPHISNPKNPHPYWLDFAKEDLAKAGEVARSYGHRITMHPGQYDVVGSPNETTFLNTQTDLFYHAQLLDYMGVGPEGVVVIHGGGLYGDKASAIDRWCTNFKRLPEAVQRRLVIENDERCFSPRDCLDIAHRVNIPVVLDNHHFDCFMKAHPEEAEEHGPITRWIGECLDTWKARGIRPKFHISEQREEARLGTHSDFIETFPDYYLEIPEKYGIGVDVMIEAKAKEAAVLKLYDKYPQLLLRLKEASK
jgi:UV DNA damage endonuclease